MAGFEDGTVVEIGDIDQSGTWISNYKDVLSGKRFLVVLVKLSAQLPDAVS